MKTVTLRKLPPKLEKTIRQRARERRVSVNKAVLSLLEEHLGLDEEKQPAEYHDLDALCGAWTEEEANAFDQALARQRIIDPDLWK